MENKKETIKGKLSRFLYQNENGWGIALFKSLDNNAQVKIKGNVGLIQPKVPYELTGIFEQHPKFGKSFEVTSFQIISLKNEDQYLNFFSETVPGIGPVVSQRIVDAYDHDDLFQAILNNPEKLELVKGLKPISRRLLVQAIKDLNTENHFTKIFFAANLKMDFLTKLKNDLYQEKNRDQIIEHILQNDFYHYAKKSHLTPFDEVDIVVMHFQKLNPDDPFRLAWNLNYLIEEVLNQTGNTYTDSQTLFKKLKDYRGIFDYELFEAALQKALDLKIIYEKSHLYFSDDSWNDEQTISEHIITNLKVGQTLLINTELITIINEVEKEIQIDENQPNFKYDENQRLALTTFANNSFFLLNGGPGTGKTTVLKGMVKLFQKLETQPRIAIAAPTGRAAARINEIDPRLNAKTIHKLLKATEHGVFEMNKNNPLEYDLIIVDEASMIENKLFARLLEAAHLAKKIVFIGDENQLPSVGYGEVFANLLEINEISKINLSTIHRQSEGNGIISLAYKILNNEVKDIKDFALPNVETHFNVPNYLTEIENIFQSNVKDQTNLLETQVISSFYKGSLGINQINQNLQTTYQTKILAKNLFEQAPHSLIRKDHAYYEHDKVMYLVNDSSIGLNNGDVGIIEQLETTNNKVLHNKIIFNEEIKHFTTDNFSSLTLNYACSVHKTQGSEYQNVIFVIENGVNNFFLNRKLIYTAITRAKKNLYLVGDLNALLEGIKKPGLKRKTGLISRLNYFLKLEKGYNF